MGKRFVDVYQLVFVPAISLGILALVAFFKWIGARVAFLLYPQRE